MAVIRSAGLRGFRAVVAERGGDAEDYARAVGLPVAALDSDDLLVADVAVAAVLELAARSLNCPDLGLRMSVRQDLGMLGPLALAIEHSATVGEALSCATRYLFLHARSLCLAMDRDPDGVRGVIGLTYGTGPSSPPLRQGADLGLGFVHRAIRLLVGGGYGLRSVELPHTPKASLRVYEEFFGVEVRPGRTAARLRVPRSLLAHPLAGSHEHVAQLALGLLAEQAHAGGSAPISARTSVHAAVRHCLGTTSVDLAAVSAVLRVHPRTLQRRLCAEGTTFGAVVDSVRRDLAREYLVDTALPIGQIASLLGFAQQSVLTHSAHRWWGAGPRAIRNDPARTGVVSSQEIVAIGEDEPMGFLHH